MNLKDFRARVFVRVFFLALSMGLLAYMAGQPNTTIALGIIGCVVTLQLVEMFRFVSQTNRKLTRFLDSVRYSDFVSGFAADNKLGKSFKDLNAAFNEVLEAFRKARFEKEEHWQYLNSVVQQVRTGILSFDAGGKIELINQTARRLLGVKNLQNIEELRTINPGLYDSIARVSSRKSELFRGIDDVHLSIQSTHLRIRGTDVKLVTLQNIQPELQKQELEAWQNLTRVLRHEIMNSITPISSLASTLGDILSHDIQKRDDDYLIDCEAVDDLREGLVTIESRSRGLIKFIDAYREYTSLPVPRMTTVRVNALLDQVVQLMKPELRKTSVEFESIPTSENLTIRADIELIEQVIINLMKNALEALADRANAKLELRASYDDESVRIEVLDNGPGIIPEALEHIFVPFYTTKPSGSGIGLSLSRQIMQLHNGSITAISHPNVKTVFTLRF